MAIANSYPIGTPKTNDLLVGTSMPTANTDADPITKNFSVSDVIALADIPFTSLTTSGTSGAATLVGGILNIPDYATGGGSGGVSSVTASTAGDALDVLVTDSSSTPQISLTWAGAGTQYIDGAGNLQTFPTIPTPGLGTVTSVSASDNLVAFTLSVTNPNTTPDISLSASGAASQYVTGEGNLQTFPSIPTLPANIVNTVTGGTNITTTNNTTTGDVVVNAPDAIVNTSDSYATPKVTDIVSLTQSDYNGLVSTPPITFANTLYIIL